MYDLLQLKLSARWISQEFEICLRVLSNQFQGFVMHKLSFRLKINIGSTYQNVQREMTFMKDNSGNDKF